VVGESDDVAQVLFRGGFALSFSAVLTFLALEDNCSLWHSRYLQERGAFLFDLFALFVLVLVSDVVVTENGLEEPLSEVLVGSHSANHSLL
jgi:hypothetical protein